MQNKIESPEKGKPFLTEDDFINEFDKFRSGIFKASLDHWIETGKPSGSFLISIKNFIGKCNAEIEREIQQATKEQEKDWYNAGCMAERIIWRDKVEQERECLKKYLMDFIEERKALCKNINDNSPTEWKSFKYVADAVNHELDFLQSVIHAIEPYKP